MEKNLSVLIIEDDYYVRKLFELVFESFKISYTGVDSLEAAKRELEFYIPTFILVDDLKKNKQELPFNEYIVKNYPCIKIMLCTNYSEIMQTKGETGIYVYIEKPFRIEKLKDIIRDLINLPRCTKAEKCFSQECSRLVLND